MKTKLFIFMIIALLFETANAQGYSNSWYSPGQTSSSRNVSLSLSNNRIFNGKETTTVANGQVTRREYVGCLTMSDGSKFITADYGYPFDANFNFSGYVWYIDPSGQLYKAIRKGSTINYNRVNKSYRIVNNSVVYDDSSSGSYGGELAPYVPGTSSGGNNGGSGSNVHNDHTATCRGCNGSGICQICHGTGLSSSGKSVCSLCKGRRKCVSCGGRGKIHY